MFYSIIIIIIVVNIYQNSIIIYGVAIHLNTEKLKKKKL